MSVIPGQIKYRIDENETVKLNNVKKIGGEANKAEKATQRAALGDIQNRAISCAAATGKEAAIKEGKAVVRAAIKPRVDTHWKKSSAVTNATTTATANNRNVIATKATRATALVQASKVLTRSNSLRSTALAKSSSTVTNVVQRQGGVSEQTKKQTIKTVTTKVVENKLQQVKILKQENIIPADTKLRREDSNISRKSLTKLKAALASKTTTTSTTTTTTAVSKSNNSNALKPIIKTEVPIGSEVTKVNNVIEQSTKTNLRIVNVKSHSALLLEGVRNIDEGDDESLILVSEYVNDIYDYLFKLESEQSIRKHHLSDQVVVTPKMRAVLLDWIHEVHSQFHLVTETFHITVGIIDRYLQAVPDTLRTQLQLVGVTALFIAAKYEELYPPAICDFIFMTDHSYNQKQLLAMEIQIFRTLDCNLSRPGSIHFLRRFSKAADVEDEQHAMSKYFLELSAIEYDLAHYKPSEIAAASLFLSLQLFNGNPQKATGYNNALWNPTLQFYSHYTAEDLRPITSKIAAIARNAPDAKLTAVYTKYQSPKFYKASMRTVLYSALMDSLILKD